MKSIMRKLLIIISVVLLLTSCESSLNPEWYPRGVGKDTVYTFGDGKFALGKTSVGIDLSMYTDDGRCGTLLALVKDYKSKKGKLYVYSDEGYCVIDKEKNTAKVLVTVEKQFFSNLVGEDRSVQYLSSFDEFSQEEQKIFNSMS